MGQLALYRAYRPNDFGEIYGQEPITKVLANAVKDGNFSHAYLFCGPRGTGKTSAARVLAKAINCNQQREGNPDNSCNNCKSINENKSLDIIEIDAASHTQVDNIREVIIERTHFAPTSLKYKVYIIDEAHMLSKSSFNALLKTLEEPPEHAVFVLATTEVNKIPATIISRCQRFDFKRISNHDLEKRLKFIADTEKLKINDKAISLIAHAGEGGFRDAISYLDQISSLNVPEITEIDIEGMLGVTDVTNIEDYIFALSEGEVEKGLEILRKITDDGLDIGQFFKNLIEYLRKLMLGTVVGISEIDMSSESSKRATETLRRTDITSIIYYMDTLIENNQLYKYSSLSQLGMEVATIKICDKQKNKQKWPEKEPGVTIIEDEEKLKGKQQPEKQERKKTTRDPSKAQWQQFLMEIKKTNNSIHAFLRVCDPEFDNQTVSLYFPYKFHKERIEDLKNRRVVEEALKRVYGVDYKVNCIIRANGNGNTDNNPIKDDLLEDALEIFGGEVVE